MLDNPINPSTSFANATQITLQTAIQPYKHALTSVDPIDVYKFTLNSINTLSFSLTELSSNARLRLFSEAAGSSGVTQTEIPGLSNNPGKLSDYISREFAAGTYYIQVESDPNPPGNTTLVNYTLEVKSLTTAASPVKPFIDWRQQRNNISLRRQTDGSVGFWSMNGTTFLGAASSIIGQEWQQIGAGDTNADNKTDIVWLNTTTNDIAVWLVDDTRVTGAAVVGKLPQDYQIAGLDDFNGDGKTDLLLRDSTKGDIAVWLLNGATFLGAGAVGTLPKEWDVYGTADVSGDGKADIVLFNQTTRQAAVWLLNGPQLVDVGAFQLPAGWTIQGLGDVNNDRRADLLLRNDTTGDAATWLLNGKNFLAAAVYGNIPPEWKIQRFGDSNSSSTLGDFNGDGNADILWRNTVTGATAIWLTSGINIISAGVLPISTNWKIEGAADYNRDGKTDLLWREETTGQIVQWLMNGVSRLSDGSISGLPLDWQLAGGTPVTVTAQPLSISGNAFTSAFNVGTLDATGTYSDLVSQTVSDYFKFNLANTSFFEMTLTPSVLIPGVGNPRKNPTLSREVVNPTTGVITYQDINYTGRDKLAPGTYYVKVANFGVSDQTYALTLKGEPLIVNLIQTAETTPPEVVLIQRANENDPPPIANTIAVSSTIKNEGNEAVGAFNVAYYLSRDNVLDQNDVSLGTQPVAGLGIDSNNNSIVLNPTLTLPNGEADFWTIDKDYFLITVTDSGATVGAPGSVTETIETDNIRITPIPVKNTLKVDLQGFSLNVLSTTVTPEGNLELQYRVQNLGNKAQTDRFSVQFWISTDAIIDTSPSSPDATLASDQINSLPGAKASPVGSNISPVRTVEIPLFRKQDWDGWRNLSGTQTFYVGMVVAISDADPANNLNRGLTFDVAPVTVNLG